MAVALQEVAPRVPPAVAVAATLPRFATAAAFVVAWLFPFHLAPELVRGLFWATVLEFLLLHSWPFLNLVASVPPGRPLRERLRAALGVAGFGAFYLLFGFVLASATKSHAALWTLGWLVVARLLEVLTGSGAGLDKTARLGEWGATTMRYLFAFLMAAILPIPALGLTAEAIARFDLPGSGKWVDEPQRVFAVGLVHFGFGAVSELRARLRAAA